MRALTLLWHHVVGKRTSIGGAIWALVLIVWHGFLKYEEGEEVFIDWLMATLVESWFPFLMGGLALLIFHVARIDLYLKLDKIENEQPRNVNKQSVLIGSLLELLTTYSQSECKMIFESTQSRAITYLNKVKTLPDMVDIRDDIEDFLKLFHKEHDGWNIVVKPTYDSEEEVKKDLRRARKLAQKLCKELNH